VKGAEGHLALVPGHKTHVDSPGWSRAGLKGRAHRQPLSRTAAQARRKTIFDWTPGALLVL
jgi:hypothetical protein